MADKTVSRLRRWLWPLIKIAAVVSIVGGIVYWMRFRPVDVIEHEISRGSISVEVMGTGTLEARVKSTISPKISGLIDDIFVDQGDQVTAGQLLVNLDDAQLAQKVAIAAADVETRKAAITRLESDITRSAAVLVQAKTNYERLNLLIQQNAISRDEVDKAAESLSIAEAEASRADAALSEGRKALFVSEQNLKFEKTKLDDSRIVAPFDGLIVRRDRDPGDVVVPGSPMLALISTKEIWINAWVDETEMAALKQGQTAIVIFRSEPDHALPGKLVRLGKETDRETREFIVDVQVMKLPENWAVGQRAEVFIETGRKDDAVLVPGDCVGHRDGHPGVFLNRNGIVAWQPVELGLRGREMVEVTHGLEPGQTVVTPAGSGGPIKPLRPGQRIANP